MLDSLDLTMDENKENQTPESVQQQQQGELDWVQQYSLDQEREEQELQQALAQSLQEHVRAKGPVQLHLHTIVVPQCHNLCQICRLKVASL